jgi:hypothetical protein
MNLGWSASDKSIWDQHKIQAGNGIIGGFNLNEATGTVDAMIDFSGKYFESKSIVDIWQIIRGLYHAYGCHGCRIDIAIDDVSYQKIPVNEMVKAYQDHNQFYFRSYDYRESDGKITHAFGSRRSDHYTRIYDHHGEYLRHETEFKGRLAKAIFETLANLEREWFHRLSSKGSNHNFDGFLQKILGSIAVSAIDFRDKSVRQDRSKASCRETQRLDFYQQFIEAVGIELRVIRQSLIQDWLDNPISKTMSVIDKIPFWKWELSINTA